MARGKNIDWVIVVEGSEVQLRDLPVGVLASASKESGVSFAGLLANPLSGDGTAAEALYRSAAGAAVDDDTVISAGDLVDAFRSPEVEVEGAAGPVFAIEKQCKTPSGALVPLGDLSLKTVAGIARAADLGLIGTLISPLSGDGSAAVALYRAACGLVGEKPVEGKELTVGMLEDVFVDSDELLPGTEASGGGSDVDPTMGDQATT